MSRLHTSQSPTREASPKLPSVTTIRTKKGSTTAAAVNQSQGTSPRRGVEEEKEDLRFNIKITDLSDLENPFVIYENKKIDQEGYIIFDNLLNESPLYTATNQPRTILPWLTNPRDPLEKRTLKIEVTYL